jgi:hypothetical protein
MGRIFLLTIWTSIFLGYFASNLNYIGGSFGFYLTEWLSLSLGRIGAIILICALGYLLIAIVFNADLKALFSRFFGNKENDISTFDEKFKFNDGKVRKQEQTLYMEDLPTIVNMAQEAGFLIHAKVDMVKCAYEYQYLYVFVKPN